MSLEPEFLVSGQALPAKRKGKIDSNPCFAGVALRTIDDNDAKYISVANPGGSP